MQAADGRSWPELVERAFGRTAFAGLHWAGAWDSAISPMLTDRPGRLAVTGGLYEPAAGTGGVLAAGHARADVLGAVAGRADGPVPAQGILALEVRTAWIMAMPALVLLGVDNPATVHAVALTPAGLTNQRTGQHALARVVKLLGPWPLLQAMSVPPGG